jgi:hypothetical protein
LKYLSGEFRKFTRDAVVIGLDVGELADRVAVEAEENRARMAEDDGRAGRNEELGVSGRLGRVRAARTSSAVRP